VGSWAGDGGHHACFWSDVNLYFGGRLFLLLVRLRRPLRLASPPRSPLLGPGKEHHHALPRPSVLDDVSLVRDRLQGEDPLLPLSDPCGLLSMAAQRTVSFAMFVTSSVAVQTADAIGSSMGSGRSVRASRSAYSYTLRYLSHPVHCSRGLGLSFPRPPTTARLSLSVVSYPAVAWAISWLKGSGPASVLALFAGR